MGVWEDEGEGMPGIFETLSYRRSISVREASRRTVRRRSMALAGFKPSKFRRIIFFF